ncbi:hypothetical protein LG3211_5364 [Lysobacter gummosus]|nr:hypothetical protein LG3211_5364 [Lysobacter gummosus]
MHGPSLFPKAGAPSRMTDGGFGKNVTDRGGWSESPARWAMARDGGCAGACPLFLKGATVSAASPGLLLFPL